MNKRTKSHLLPQGRPKLIWGSGARGRSLYRRRGWPAPDRQPRPPMKMFATLVLSIVMEAGAGERRGKGGAWWLMVTQVVTWLLQYAWGRLLCGLMSHKQLVTTNLFNLHFDFVTCHKQLLHHAYWVTLWAASLENILILKIQWTSRDENIDKLFVGWS